MLPTFMEGSSMFVVYFDSSQQPPREMYMFLLPTDAGAQRKPEVQGAGSKHWASDGRLKGLER